MMRLKFGLCAFSIFLASCGSGDTEGGEASGDEAAGAADVQTVSDKGAASDFTDARTYSLAEAMDTEMFGLKFNMTIDETRDALIKAGFGLPEGWEYRGSPGVKQQAADVGLKRIGNRDPGHLQEYVHKWMRIPGNGDINVSQFDLPVDVEYLAPSFYINNAGEQRLFRVGYEQRFKEDVNPALYAETLKERLGEPSSLKKWGDSISAKYVVQMPVPKGLEPTASDDRKPDQVGQQRKVELMRGTCATYLAKTDDLPDGCGAIFEGDRNAQYLFEALTINTSQFKQFSVAPGGVAISLSAPWLGRREEYIFKEGESRKKAEERRATSERTTDAPSGL